LRARGRRAGFDAAMVPITAEDTTLAELLQKAGYATGCFGKGGLGWGATSDPLRRGFATNDSVRAAVLRPYDGIAPRRPSTVTHHR
jgi:arylsulfatase A-like enzyme